MIRSIFVAAAAISALCLPAPLLAASKEVGEFLVENKDGACSASAEGDTGLFMIFAPDGTDRGSFGFTVANQTGLPEGMVPIQLGIEDDRFDFTASYSNNPGGFGVYIIPMDSDNPQDLLGGFPESWPFIAFRDGKQVFSIMVEPNSALTAELVECVNKRGIWG